MVIALVVCLAAVSASSHPSSVQEAMIVGSSSASLVMIAQRWEADEVVARLSQLSQDSLGVLQSYLRLVVASRMSDRADDLYQALACLSLEDHPLSELVDHCSYVSRILNTACVAAAAPLLAELDKERRLANDCMALATEIFHPSVWMTTRSPESREDYLKTSLDTWRLKTAAKKLDAIIRSSYVEWLVGPQEIITLTDELVRAVSAVNRALAEFLCSFPACPAPMPEEARPAKPLKLHSPRPMRGEHFQPLVVEEKSPSPRALEAIRPSLKTKSPMTLGKSVQIPSRSLTSPHSAFHPIRSNSVTEYEREFLSELRGIPPSSLDQADLHIWTRFKSLGLHSSLIVSEALAQAARAYLRDTELDWTVSEALDMAEAYVLAESASAPFYIELARVVIDTTSSRQSPATFSESTTAKERLGCLRRYLINQQVRTTSYPCLCLWMSHSR